MNQDKPEIVERYAGYAAEHSPYTAELLRRYAALLREREAAKGEPVAEMVYFSRTLPLSSTFDRIPVLLGTARDHVRAELIHHIDPLYTAPPAERVIVPDPKEVPPVPAKLNSESVYGYCIGWNDCRKAMLTAISKVSDHAPKREEGEG